MSLANIVSVVTGIYVARQCYANRVKPNTQQDDLYGIVNWIQILTAIVVIILSFYGWLVPELSPIYIISMCQFKRKIKMFMWKDVYLLL